MACLKAHEIIIDTLPPQAREDITSKEMKSAVLAYVALDDQGKKELLKKIVLSGYGTKNEKPEAPLKLLAEAWFEQKAAQGVTDKQRNTMLGQKSTTANLYGKFVPEHFKVGFEAAIKERKELVEWLEGGYFG